jgi:hypothetical protein
VQNLLTNNKTDRHDITEIFLKAEITPYRLADMMGLTLDRIRETTPYLSE